MPDAPARPAADLADLLRRRIALEGPISVADWMATCLGHPRFGYYIRQDPFGAAGDFITAPEISQVFGELIGLWCAALWLARIAPAPCTLAEIGPGRGTLMADALRATRRVPGMHDGLSVHLVETSPALSAIQARALQGAPVSWTDDVANLPDGPVLLVANELLDALPIRQLIRTERGWCERLVDLDGQGGFRFVLARQPSALAALLPPEAAGWPLGAVAEVSPAAIGLAAALGSRIARDGGAALLIDYGRPVPGHGDTLQALRRHVRHDPLSQPGDADLTAHVDFPAVVRAAREAGAAVYGPIGQGDFLRALGIEARLARLAVAVPARAADLQSAGHRLIAPDAMGTLFQVMAVVPAGSPVPPGFEMHDSGMQDQP